MKRARNVSDQLIGLIRSVEIVPGVLPQWRRHQWRIFLYNRPNSQMEWLNKPPQIQAEILFIKMTAPYSY